jgi:hypothetical protein
MKMSLVSVCGALLYKLWKYGRLGLAVLAFILVVLALSVGPVRMADFIAKCGDSFQHFWK